MRQFGDVLATLGALEAIKTRWPERRLTYVIDSHYHPLLESLEFIDELLPSPPRGGGPARVMRYLGYVSRIRSTRPAAVVDFHGNARSALLTRLVGAPVRVGWRVRGRRHAYTVAEPRAEVVEGAVRPRTSLESAMCLVRHLDVGVEGARPSAIRVGADELARARRRLERTGVPARALESGGVVGLNPGRPFPAKAWALTRFASLAQELVAAGRHVVVTWGPREREAAAEVVAEAARGRGPGSRVTLAPETHIDDLPGMIGSLSALVTIDSGLKHLAVCVGVPTVTLFGATDPREWHMGGRRDRVLWRGLSCSPCRRRVCPFGTPCMDIPVVAVMEAVEDLSRGQS
jgi:ADP-heptose:LPS heptosyltransferase